MEEVNELVKPADSALELVHEWLLEHGIKKERLRYTPAQDWIQVSLPVSAVERLLDTEYSVYQHEDGSHLVRTSKWSLPAHLHEHIEAVVPTNSFFRPAPRRSTVMTVDSPGLSKAALQLPSASNPSSDLSVAQVCNATNVTPLCLRTLYGTVDYTPQVPGKNRVGLTDYLSEANNRSDTYLFLKQFRPEAAAEAYSFNVEVIAGGDDQQTPDNATQLAAGKDLEGNLDAETIIGIDYPTPLTAYTTGGSPPFIPDLFTPTDSNEPYLTWLQYVLAQETIPQVISTSYADDEQTVPYSYAKTVCNSFAQLGARGVSLFFGSGDSGVGESGDCLTNDGTNRSTFLPEFPTSCPFITAVGATKNFAPEVVAYDARNGFVSGGGFSNYFPRPTYQRKVVGDYIASLGNQFGGLYNTTGRGYPDVSAQGFRFVTVWNGTIKILDGTSASTPTFAAVISLVNDALIADGKPPLGFLNPWLYKKGYKALTDVTMGSALGCNTTGFPAQTGWDAVTGFGTPVSGRDFSSVGVRPMLTPWVCPLEFQAVEELGAEIVKAGSGV